MTSELDPVHEDFPEPPLGDLQQRLPVYPAVPVQVSGPVQTHELPSRMGVAFTQVLSTDLQSVVGKDLSRKRLTLLGDAAWVYSHSPSGPGVTWPANVPLVLLHCDAVYAKQSSGAANLMVIPEHWAD